MSRRREAESGRRSISPTPVEGKTPGFNELKRKFFEISQEYEIKFWTPMCLLSTFEALESGDAKLAGEIKDKVDKLGQVPTKIDVKVPILILFSVSRPKLIAFKCSVASGGRSTWRLFVIGTRNFQSTSMKVISAILVLALFLTQVRR